MARILSSLMTLLVAALLYCCANPALADGLSVDSNFVDTTSQSPTLCINFNEALKPGLDAHYEDYVRVDHFTGLVIQVSGKNLCIGGVPYEKSYHVTLLSGLPSQSGDTLSGNSTVTFAPGDRPALVAINGNGLYLAKRSAAGLALTSVNINKLSVHVLRLNGNNAIADFAASQSSNLFNTATQSMAGDDLNSLIAGQAGVIWSGTMPVKSQPNVAVNTLFPVDTAIGQSTDKLATKPGVYLVVAEDAANAAPPGFWTGTLSQDDSNNIGSKSFASHWVIVTDIGITALTGDDGMHVGVRSVASAAVMAGVRLDLISQGGDVLTSVTSDAAGNAVIPKALMAGTLANTPLALAAYGPDGDFSYLPLDRAAFDLSDRGVAGRNAPMVDDAFIFAERGIYRPGETVQAVVLLRDANGNALPNQKFTLGLVRTDTLQVASVPAVTDDAGGAVVPVSLPANALHGQWSLQASIDPNLPPVGQLSFEVHNFQPADMRVASSGAPAFAKAGDALKLAATGSYLYGAPAASLPVQAKLTISVDNHPVSGATGYSFGLLNDKPADISSDIDNDGADADGKVALTATIPALPTTTSPLQGEVSVGFVEPSGVITKSNQNFKLISTPNLLGIKPLFDGGAVQTGTPAAFDVAAFDPVAGKMVAATGLMLRLVRTDIIYDWVGHGNSWTWRSYTLDHPVELSKLDVAAGEPANVTRSLPDGDYTLIVSDPATGAASSLAFSVGWSGIGTAASTPDTLRLTSDHAQLSPGGTATVKITGPFAGSADIYVANNQLYQQQQIAVPAGGTTTTITAGPNWNGGAYVIADLHRGSADASGHASVRAIGVGWIGLDATPHTLGVQIMAPAQILPRTQQNITVKISNAAAGQKVHLVLDAVDEGILGLTNYRTPDPAGWFWGQRRLGVEIRDMFGALLNDQGQAGSIEQGGDEAGGGPRLPMQSTKLFAVASADLTVGPDGTVQIPLDVPDFEGQVRLSAVAWSLDATGSSKAEMLVRDPVVMTLGLPPFLSTGDQASIPVTMSNVDGPAGSYSMGVTAQGLSLANAAPQTVTLAKAAQTLLRIPVTANAAGVAQLDLILTGPAGMKIERHFSLPIRAVHPPSLVTLFGTITPGAVITLPAEIAKSGATDGTAQISASGFPGLDAQSLLAALAADHDDHDTVTLAARAIALLDPASQATFPGGAAAAKKTINDAIAIIVNRQMINGDVGNYSFNDYGGFNDWVTADALDFLFAAQAAGYDVPPVVLTRSASWLRSEGAVLIQIMTSQSNAYGAAAPAPFSSFVYTQWLLARTGRADIGALRVVADGLQLAQSPDNKTLIFWAGGNTPDHLAAAGDLAKLALALQLAGDSNRAKQVLNQAGRMIGTNGPSAWAESFWWTQNQDIGVFLYAAATLGDQPDFAKAALRLDPAALLQNNDVVSMAWLLRAASAGNQRAAASGTTVQFTLGGQSQTVALPGSVALPWSAVMQAAALKIVSGSGYYGVTAHYTPTVPAAAFAHGMDLHVSYQDFTGKPLDLKNLHQGQDVVVLIAGSVPAKRAAVLNIAALLPGCFSIEKAMPGPKDYPSLTLSPTQSFSTDTDRFLATLQLGNFAWNSSDDNSDASNSSDTPDQKPLPPGSFAVAYLAKVTTVGSFTLPEVTVRDRLHPAISAGSGSQAVTVLP